MPDHAHSVDILIKRLATVLACTAVLLTVVSWAARTTTIISGAERNQMLSFVFVNQDDSVPSFYAAMLLMGCAVVLAGIALDRFRETAPHRVGWIGLAVVFAYLSMDEAVSVHESFTLTGRGMLDAFGLNESGLIGRAWVVPALLALILFAMIYARFFLALPRRTKLLFTLGFLLFFGGAVGMEVASDVFVYSLGGVEGLTGTQNRIRTVVFTHTEELMEMLGSITFLYAFLEYLIRTLGSPAFVLRAVEK